MHVVLFSPTQDDLERTLHGQIRHVVPQEDIILCRTPRELALGLLRPSYEILAVVIYPGSNSQLKKLEELKDHLSDVRVILVLPLSSREALEDAHRLKPRFVFSSTEQIPLISQVLERMNRKAADYAHRIGGKD